LKWILFVAFLIAASVLGALMMQKYFGREHVPVAPARPEATGTMRVSLFFASPDGNGLVREASEIDSCGNDLADCIQEAIEKLVGGPLGDLAPTLPAATIVNDVQVRDDTAYLDFGGGLADGLPGGSSAEMTAVYSIVDTVSFNFPRIKKVKFLLDGHAVETLKGHIDLRTPLVPDFSLEKTKVGKSAPEQQ
jgi:hypothetical protein